MSSTKQSVSILNRLVRLNKDSERGFETAAEHVHNRGLKLLLKSYAGQRHHFAQELAGEITELGASSLLQGGRVAALHRGWIDLKAALTIGRTNIEQVVLTECHRGERVALQKYLQASQSALPERLRQQIAAQAVQIHAVHDKMEQMAGQEDTQLIVQLFDEPTQADAASHQLQQLGFQSSEIELSLFDEDAASYTCDCHGSRVLDSGIAGALSGLLFGLLLGLLAGASALIDPLTGTWGGAGMIWETLFKTGAIGAGAGLLLGGLIGVIVGQSMVEDDTFIHQRSLHDGVMLLLLQTDRARIPEARQILTIHRMTEVAAQPG